MCTISIIRLLTVFLTCNIFVESIFDYLKPNLCPSKWFSNDCLLKDSDTDESGLLSSYIPYGLFMRGGQMMEEVNGKEEINEKEKYVTCIVSSNIGSTFLDKKKKIILPYNATIKDIKQQIQHKFPGSPPFSLQKLFFGIQKLDDSKLIHNITSISPIPLLLDIISGTSSYNKTMTISQAIEAYISLTVHQIYLGEQINQFYQKSLTNTSSNNDDTISTAFYRDIFTSVNSSIYEQYSEDISDALIEEQDPEVISLDTIAWRGKGQIKKQQSPLAIALAKEFDLNIKGVKGFIYYTFLLGVFAAIGTTSKGSSRLLLLMVPFLWASKLRQLRLASKIVLYLLLPVIHKIDFLMPLLPAPYQVIAQQSVNWSDKEEEEGEGDEEKDDKDIEADNLVLKKPKSLKKNNKWMTTASTKIKSEEDERDLDDNEEVSINSNSDQNEDDDEGGGLEEDKSDIFTLLRSKVGSTNNSNSFTSGNNNDKSNNSDSNKDSDKDLQDDVEDEEEEYEEEDDTVDEED